MFIMARENTAPDKPVFSFKYGNILQVNKEFLDAKETSPELFEKVMHQLGSQAISEVIETQHQRILKNNSRAHVQRGAVWLLNLASTKEEALTPSAVVRGFFPQKSYSDVYRSVDNIQEYYRPYWGVVANMNLIPVVQYSSDKALRGVCLLARDVELDTAEY
jgi:hypothetical protein